MRVPPHTVDATKMPAGIGVADICCVNLFTGGAASDFTRLNY